MTDMVSPEAGAFLAALPVAMLSIALVPKETASHYAFSLGLGILVQVVVVFSLWYVLAKKMNKHAAVAIAAIAWLLLSWQITKIQPPL